MMEKKWKKSVLSDTNQSDEAQVGEDDLELWVIQALQILDKHNEWIGKWVK